MPLFEALFVPLLTIIDMALELYLWGVFVMIVISWLYAFNVLNRGNRFVEGVNDFLQRITEPLLRQLRRFVPVIGGVDLSPLVLVFGIMFVRLVIRQIIIMGVA